MLLHHHRILRTNDERWWGLLLFALSVFKWGPRASPLLWNRAQKSNSQHFWRANLGWTLFSCARLRFDGARGPGQRCGRRCVSPYFDLFFFYLCLPRIIFVINDFIVVVSARRLFFFPSNFSTRPQAHTHTHTHRYGCGLQTWAACCLCPSVPLKSNPTTPRWTKHSIRPGL